MTHTPQGGKVKEGNVTGCNAPCRWSAKRALRSRDGEGETPSDGGGGARHFAKLPQLFREGHLTRATAHSLMSDTRLDLLQMSLGS